MHKYFLPSLLCQDIDTAIVSDTTDDLWFLNEPAPDQLNVIAEVETADCEEGKEGDKKVLVKRTTLHTICRLAVSADQILLADPFTIHLSCAFLH